LFEIAQLNLSEAKPNNAIKLNEKTVFGNQGKVEYTLDPKYGRLHYLTVL
jgi:hypothetical protein